MELYRGIKTTTDSGSVKVQVVEATKGKILGLFSENSPKIPEYCTIFEENQEHEFWLSCAKCALSEEDKNACYKRAEKALFRAIEIKCKKKGINTNW